MKSLPYNVYEEIYNETGLDLGNRFEKMGRIATSMEKNIRNIVEFVRVIPGFLDLSTKDQLQLIKCKPLIYTCVSYISLLVCYADEKKNLQSPDTCTFLYVYLCH